MPLAAIALGSNLASPLGQPADNLREAVRRIGALGEVISLTRESAGIIGQALGLSPYDALMSQYQRGITAAEAGAIFARYEGFLKHALPRAEAKTRNCQNRVAFAHEPAALGEEV